MQPSVKFVGEQLSTENYELDSAILKSELSMHKIGSNKRLLLDRSKPRDRDIDNVSRKFSYITNVHGFGNMDAEDMHNQIMKQY